MPAPNAVHRRARPDGLTRPPLPAFAAARARGVCAGAALDRIDGASGRRRARPPVHVTAGGDLEPTEILARALMR
ncbi:MAG TPA: hypothetical protein VK279_05790 [Solirubrobacteraceae bacterium]|nr:hypothetical protein [Solirubrobacteraceae bacterium]